MTASILVEWPSHPHEAPYELTDADLRELRAHAAAERISTDEQRPGDEYLASVSIDTDTVITLRSLGLLQYPGGEPRAVTDAGYAVLAKADGGAT